MIAVIVLYKMAPGQSASFSSLLTALAAVPAGDLQLKILLYDNTPNPNAPGPLPANTLYVAAADNAGLADAYNQALELAEAEGSAWLLTLDQDTDLPADFLIKVSSIARQVESTPVIAAIVPRITENGKVFSPYWFQAGAFPRWFRKDFAGVSSQAAFAFNSASTMRVSALRQVGGYSPWFWLDNSDAYMFRQLHRHGKQVFVAGNIEVVHSFSMVDIQSRVTPDRYRNILLAESAFWDMEMGVLAGLERTARLVVRACIHFGRRNSTEINSVTCEFLWRRLFWTKKRRLREWQTETRQLCPQLATSAAFLERATSRRRLKVSICMAAYNGERFIEKQLRSILGQLDDHDEVIVVDDASKDSTRDKVKSVDDARMRLIEHPTNRGVVATFEDAVRNATGDILFLADDDDIWAPDKVQKVLEAFDRHPGAQIVTTRVSMIDEHDAPSQDTLYSNRKGFHSGFWQNVLRNHFQGSAMAFRSSLLGDVLPFPMRGGFLHDHWIGTRNAILNGAVVFIDEPLLFYRRHSHNLSRKMTRLRQAKVRLQLLWTHLLRYGVR
jgi:glycosyltransferase involved in cell wall biosynthesis